MHANTRAHVHLLHVDALTQSHTPKLQIHWWRVYVNHDTETLLHTDIVGMVTIYISSDPHPPNPLPVTVATISDPSPSMAGFQDQWISQLAILNIPQTDFLFSFAWDCTKSSLKMVTLHIPVCNILLYILVLCSLICNCVHILRHVNNVIK